jgi:cystathionine beta-lyase/cystathionine gamma-synthase
MERHAQNAQAIAEKIVKHPAIRRAVYPGLPAHPHHALAKRQMSGFGGIVAFDVGSREAAHTLLESVKIFSLAESLGGVESLISVPAEMTHASVPAEDRARLGITPGLVRISVGIEDVGDICRDLDRALTKAAGA